MTKTGMVAVALVGAIFLIAGPGSAQPAGTHFSKVDVPGSLVPEKLLEVQRALELKDLDAAIDVLQTLLDHHCDEVAAHKLVRREDNETDPVLPKDLFRGVREDVMRRILALPDDGLQRYRERMDPVARGLMQDATLGHSESILRRVAQRYFLTVSGEAAYFCLVDQLLEDGHVDEARICAERLAADIQEFGGQNPSGALGRVALCLHGSGRRAQLTSLLERISSDGGDLKLSVAGKSSSLSLFVAELLAKMPSVEPGARTFTPDLKTLDFKMWALGTARSPKESSNSLIWGRGYSRAWFGHYPVIPTVSGGVLYYCDGLKLGARTLFSGEELWPDVKATMTRRQGLKNRDLFFSVVVDDGLLFGYLEDEPQTRRRRAMNNSYAPIEAMPRKRLVAVETATGKVLWNHARYADPRPEVNEFLSRLTVNSPPVPVGNRLFVAGSFHRGAFRQWVCAFEKTTGRLIWRTYVGEGQMELNMFGNPIKEAVPGHLLEHEGVLYWATNVGTIAAVDAATGAIKWISAYEQVPIPSTRSQFLSERYPGWTPSAPVAWKDRIFIAPSDSYELYAVDVRDGSLQSVPNARRTVRNRNRYFLGIHEGNILVAGFTVTAINADSFNISWESTEVSPHDRNGTGSVKGRPAVAGGRIIFTTKDGNGDSVAYSIDLSSGAAMEEVRLGSDMSGNMTATLGCITVSDESSTRVFMDLVRVEKRLRDSVDRSPRDPELRLRLGDIRRQQGEIGKALRELEKAHDLAKARGRSGRRTVERAQLALYQVWLLIAEDPDRRIPGVPAGAEERYRRALTYASTDRQCIDALVASLLAAHEAENDRAFFSVTRELLDEYPDGSVVINHNALDLFPIGAIPDKARLSSGVLAAFAAGHRRATKRQGEDAVAFFQEALSRFASRTFGDSSVWNHAGRCIEKLIAEEGKGVYRKQEAKARTLFRKGRDEGDLRALREVLDRYPQSSLVEKSFVLLSRSLLDKKAYKQALREMQRHLGRSKTISAQVLVEAIRCLTVLEAWDSALEIMALMEKRHANTMIEVNKRRMQVRAWVSSMQKEEPFRSLLEPAPVQSISYPLVRKWKNKSDSPRNHARLLLISGRRPGPTGRLVYLHQAGKIQAVRATDGKTAWMKACPTIPRKAMWHDGRLVLHLNRDVLVLDPENGQEIWRVALENADIRDTGAGHGKVYLLCQSFSDNTWYLDGRDVVTGESVQITSVGRVSNPSLDVYAEQLLIRSYKKVRCLDPLTGRMRESGIIRCDSEMHDPTLTETGLLVMLRGPGARNYQITQPTKVVGVDPMTGETRWEHNLGQSSVKVLAYDRKRMVISVAKIPQGSRNRTRRVTIVVLDIVRGSVVCRSELKNNESVTAGRLGRDHVYLKVRKAGRKVNSTENYARVMSARTGQTNWDSIPFHGQRVRLQFLPMMNHLLVRKSDTSTLRRSQVAPPCSIFFLNMKSGKAESAIEFDEAWYTYDNPNMQIVGDRLIVASGATVFGFGR